MNRNKIPSSATLEYMDEEREPRVVTYESGARVLVYDEPGDKVTIGAGHKYFEDPKLSGGMLCFEATRDDGVRVESYVTPDTIVTARYYEDFVDGAAYDVYTRNSNPQDEAAIPVPVGNDIHGREFVIGEDITEIPGYARGGMTLKSISAEHKYDMGCRDTIEGKSPFETIKHKIEKQRRNSEVGSVALGTQYY